MKKIALTSLLLASFAFATPYNVDTAHTAVGFKIKHMMVSSTNGKFKNFNGTFDYDEATKTVSNIKGTISVDSIDTDNVDRDKHLKSPDFFDSAKYKDIKFVSKSIKENKVTGELTIKGITKTVTLNYDFGGATVNPWGQKVAGFSISGTIDRRDFGLIWNKALDMGGVAVANEVKISVDVEGAMAK